MYDRRGAVALALISWPLLAGCARPKAVESREASHVIVCPGIAGADPLSGRLAKLIDGLPGVSAQLWDWTSIEWTGDVTGLMNLTGYERNRRRAGVLAKQIEAWRGSHPAGRLSLVGVSGGAGIVCFAAADLPGAFAVERIVLISGAVSPTFDLGPVLRRTRGGLFNYYSRRDIAILDQGTRMNGTMDRQFAASCGFCGFERPAGAETAAKLLQLEWTPDMEGLGNDGGHLGGLATPFVRRYILPLFSDTAAPPAGWTF